MVRLIRLWTPSFPATVINPSANARARVPASVDKSPQLNTPRDNLGDITFESKDIFTPAQIAKPRKICLVLTSLPLTLLQLHHKPLDPYIINIYVKLSNRINRNRFNYTS